MDGGGAGGDRVRVGWGVEVVLTMFSRFPALS